MSDEVVRPDGVADTYHHVRIPPAVTVLALDEQNQAVVTRQWIYTLAGLHWRLPSGGVDAGDTGPLAAARRELADETGYHAAQWADLGVVHETDSCTNRASHLWLATGLTSGEQRLEGGEADLQHRLVPLEELVQWVGDGRITHAPSVISILKARDLDRPASTSPPVRKAG